MPRVISLEKPFFYFKEVNAKYFRITSTEFAFILLAAATILFWPYGRIINTFDYDFAYDPDRALERALFILDNYSGYGAIGVRNLAGLFPNAIYYWAGYSIGIPLDILQRILLFLIVTFSGTGALSLYRVLDKQDAHRRGGIFTATVYMFNPIASIFIWNQFASSYYSYAFLPLILAFVIIAHRERSVRWLCFTALAWTALITPSYMNPVNAIMDWFVLIVFLMAVTKMEGRRLRDLTLFLLLLLILWLLLNSYWIIPESQYISQEFGKSDVSDIGITSKELLYSNCVPFSKAFLQTGYWALYSEYQGDPWYSWSALASSAVFITASMIISIVAISSILLSKNRHLSIFLTGLTLFCLLMINGVYPPFGELFERVFDAFPPLYAFRSIYQKFGPILALSMSLMFGLAVSTILPDRLPKNRLKGVTRDSWRWLVTIMCVFSVVVIAIPYFENDVVLKGGDVVRSAWTDVPSGYYEANEWLEGNDGGYYILPLPYCKLYYAAYNWDDGYWGWEPSIWLFQDKVLGREYDDVNAVLVNVTEGMLSDAPDFNVTKMLTMLNIRYVLLHNDTNWEFIDGHSWWVRSDITNGTEYQMLIEQNGLKLEREFDDLIFYENPYWTPGNYRIVDNLITVVGTFNDIKQLTLEDWYDPSTMAIACVENVSDYDSSLKNNILYPFYSDIGILNAGEIEYLDYSPVHRDLTLFGNGHYLVMSERFNTGWTINVSSSHFVVNGFMNCWYFSDGVADNNSVEIIFQPQYYYYFSTTITIISVLGILIIVFNKKIKNKIAIGLNYN